MEGIEVQKCQLGSMNVQHLSSLMWKKIKSTSHGGDRRLLTCWVEWYDKVLETSLKQMWVRKGIIFIIDLSNDYYLVAFTHEDDKNAALSDEPWFIYDHYLTSKELSRKFHPTNDTIKTMAVWIRISGLPVK